VPFCANVAYVGRDLRSVVAQDDRDWEAVVVDDSPDGTDAEHVVQHLDSLPPVLWNPRWHQVMDLELYGRLLLRGHSLRLEEETAVCRGRSALPSPREQVRARWPTK